MKENFFTNRQGAIGASQIAGVVYYYSDRLLAENIFSQETYNEIKKMEEVSVNVWKQEMSDIKYIESPWSIKEKMKLTAEELELLSKKTSNNNTKRGNELERPVFDKFLQDYKNCEEVVSYNKKASKQYKNFIAIATIDFLINITGIYDRRCIVEIKTKNTGLDAVGNPVKEKINWISYKLQVAMQMALHKIDNAVIVLQQVATRDKEHDISADLDIEAMSIDYEKVIDCEEDKELIVAVETALDYFDADFNNDFKPQPELKKDAELLEFLARKELIMDLPSELNDDIAEMSQLEPNYNRYCELKDKVEKKLKTIATENQRSVNFRGCPFNVQMTLPTKWSADDIVKKQEATKKDYEASLSLVEGSVKTKSMFKLIKSK